MFGMEFSYSASNGTLFVSQSANVESILKRSRTGSFKLLSVPIEIIKNEEVEGLLTTEPY